MLDLRDVTRRFGDTIAVNRVSLGVREGELVGIIGSSGAGKSTLLRMINRLISPSAGHILYAGTDVTALKGRELLSWRASCAMVFQQFNLVKRMDVLSNVLVGAVGRHGPHRTLTGIFPLEERRRAARILGRVGILDQAFKRCDRLSGGQQQRVGIARALMQNPRIILADEPIASLDPRNAGMVMELLRSINREEGITVVCSLHHLSFAREYCDRIIGMAGGHIVFDGPPGELSDAEIREIYGMEADEEEKAVFATADSE